MDFGQVLQKANVACFSSGLGIEDYFVAVTEMVPRAGQLGLRTHSVKWPRLPLVLQE